MKSIKLNLNKTNDYFTREAFKVLRTNIQFCGTNVKVIAFTSSGSNEGKTTICIELARAMSEIGKKILFVDADMRKSVLTSKYTEEKGVLGLSQYLSGMAEKDEVIYSVEDMNLDMIFAGKYPPNPVELLGGERFSNFIEETKSDYDYIFIDTAPLGMVIDAAVAATVCDSAVLVISLDNVSHHVALRLKQQIEKSGCNVIGVVLNQTQKKKEGYYKKYYGKYQSYGYYSNYDAKGDKQQTAEKEKV